VCVGVEDGECMSEGLYDACKQINSQKMNLVSPRIVRSFSLSCKQGLTSDTTNPHVVYRGYRIRR
jgi:hypothetical protein